MRPLHLLTRLGLASSITLLAVGTTVADDTAPMRVTAVVAPACQLSAVPNLDFGVLDQTIDNDAQTDITWVCTNGFPTEIRINGGGSGNIAARSMLGLLPYQLYTDAGRSQLFGDGTTGNVVFVNGTGYGNPDIVTVYGRVTQGDAAAAVGGNYDDTVTVTIVF